VGGQYLAVRFIGHDRHVSGQLVWHYLPASRQIWKIFPSNVTYMRQKLPGGLQDAESASILAELGKQGF
jgi:hypothetical protein